MVRRLGAFVNPAGRVVGGDRIDADCCVSRLPKMSSSRVTLLSLPEVLRNSVPGVACYGGSSTSRMLTLEFARLGPRHRRECRPRIKGGKAGSLVSCFPTRPSSRHRTRQLWFRLVCPRLLLTEKRLTPKHGSCLGRDHRHSVHGRSGSNCQGQLGGTIDVCILNEPSIQRFSEKAGLPLSALVH